MPVETSRTRRGPKAAPDLPGRIRRAIASRDADELQLLKPVIHALAYDVVTLGEIWSLSVDQARELVFAKDREVGVVGRRTVRVLT